MSLDELPNTCVQLHEIEIAAWGPGREVHLLMRSSSLPETLLLFRLRTPVGIAAFVNALYEYGQHVFGADFTKCLKC